MRTVEEVRLLISQRLGKHWAESILAETSGGRDLHWPWSTRLTGLSGDALNDNWGDVWRWILLWNGWANSNHCRIDVTNRRVGGATRAIPTRVSVPDVDIAAAVAGSGWPERLHAARERARALHAAFPDTLTPLLLRNACQLDDVDFTLTCAAAAWFRSNDATGLTARQVPVEGLHAKWLERHKHFVSGLAGRPELGLVSRPSRIHFSYLDACWLGMGRRRRDAISLDEPDLEPGYRPDVILICENKDSALFFPEVDRGIVIEGSGDAVTRLTQIAWVRECRTVVYWGDLDAHGFVILDRLRSAGIPAASILMDEATLARFALYASPTYADGSPLPCGGAPTTRFLSPAEQRVLGTITDPSWDGPRRIEQERIPLLVAFEKLQAFLARRDGPAV